MSLKAKFLRGSALNVLEHFARLAVMLLVTPLIVDSLGVKEYGIWLLLMTVISYYDYLEFGTAVAGVRYLARTIGSDSDEDYRRTAATLRVIYHRIAWLCLIAVAVTLAVIYGFGIGEERSGELLWLVLICGLVSAFRFFLRIHLVILKSHVRYDLIVFASLSKLAVQTALVVGLLMNGHGILALLAGFVGAGLTDQLMLLAFSRRSDPGDMGREHYDSSLAREMLRYSGTLFLGISGNSLRSSVDPPIVAGFCGVNLVPVYTIGTRIIQQFVDLANAVLGGTLLAAFSQIAGQSGENSLGKRFLDSLKFSIPAAVFMMTLAFLYGPHFLVRWLGPEFQESGTVLRILIVPFAFEMAFYPSAPLFLALDKQHYIAWTRLGGALFNIALSVALVMAMGFFGVVIATAIEITILFAFVIPLLLRRVTKLSFAQVFGLQIPKTLLTLTLPMTILYLLTARMNAPSYLKIAIMAASQCAMVAPVLFFLCFDSAQRSQVIANARTQLLRKFRTPDE